MHKRNLPWRYTRDPYKIMVSEFMLQQTQVGRVIHRYPMFLEQFPTMHDLAKATRVSVITEWSGLGYNRRAVFLHDCAKEIVAKYTKSREARSGKGTSTTKNIRKHSRHILFPRDPNILEKLPGIGPYMSRAILIFSFNADLAAVDTNIRRILISEGFATESTNPTKLQKIAQGLVPSGVSRDWHNALMDYGALIQTAQQTGIRPLTTQSKFYKSFRWYRSKVMKYIIEREVVTIRQLTYLLEKDQAFVGRVLDSLVKDKLVIIQNQHARLPK